MPIRTSVPPDDDEPWEDLAERGSTHPRAFYAPRSVDPDAPGVLHAKSVVVDDERLFVTSANFTGAALDYNIELGLLIRDRPLAVSVVKHLQGLIDRNLLRGLPGP